MKFFERTCTGIELNVIIIMIVIRAVFTGVFKRNRSCITTPHDWLTELAPIFTNQNESF